MEIGKFQKISKMMEEELEDANEKFMQFNSRHEAYGVILEELQEANEEINDVKLGINENYWKMCRYSKKIKYNSKEIKVLLACLESGIVNCIHEMIQLGAMIKKARQLEEYKENTEEKGR